MEWIDRLPIPPSAQPNRREGLQAGDWPAAFRGGICRGTDGRLCVGVGKRVRD